jgi:plasmid stabilization system protein ParE
MAFRVEFRPRGEQDLEALFRRLVQEARYAASNGQKDWRVQSSLYRPCRTGALSTGSSQGPPFPSAGSFTGDIRIFPHIYKIYFNVESDTVWILHIRHGARREPKRLELFES